MPKIEIDVEKVFANADERDKWNKIDIENTVFVRNGSKIEVPKEEISRFKFMGLNTTDFILMLRDSEN